MGKSSKRRQKRGGFEAMLGQSQSWFEKATSAVTDAAKKAKDTASDAVNNTSQMITGQSSQSSYTPMSAGRRRKSRKGRKSRKSRKSRRRR